jgi:hypothetical protein
MFKSQDNNPYSFNVRTNETDFLLDQNVEHYKNYANESRLKDEHLPTKRQYRSFAIIPDIVSIDILTKYHINVHDPETMKDPSVMRRFKQIIISEYPHLLTSNVKSA